MLSNILVATDFSDASEHALDHAIDLAEAYGARVHLVHALHFPEDPSMTGTWWSTLRGRVVERLDASADRVERKGLSCEVHVLDEHPVEAILKAVETTGADLIVIGTHGAGAARLLLGSVASRVLRLAPCPVLTVR